MEWENNKQDKIKELTAKGIIPATYDMDNASDDPKDAAENLKMMMKARPWLMGQVKN